MAKLEKVCWVILDDTDVYHLSRKHTVRSAVKTTENPVATADEHIVAKVYLGASKANGLSCVRSYRIGPFTALGFCVLLYALLVGLVDIAFAIWQLAS